MRRPFFSIVTPALNCAQYLPRNLASVRLQGVAALELEHWVIDGGSKDGSVDFLQRQKDIKYISEKDRGLSDAVNKGIRRATGDWIVWLNADDELAPGALAGFQNVIRDFPEVYLFCGKQEVLSYDGKIEVINESWDYNLEDLLGRRTAILQASTFVHRCVYEKVGLLDVNIRYAMGYEWVVRAAHHFRCQPLKIVLTRYHRRKGSLMDAHLAGQMRECLQQRRKYGKPRLSLAELYIRLFIYTDWLRRIHFLRKGVRQIKRFLGREPALPMS